jgi:histone demethylase JARID1
MKIAREAHQRVANAISWQTSLAALKQRISSGSSAEPVHDDGKETRLNLSRLEELLNDPPVPMPKSETQPFRDVLSAGMKLEGAHPSSAGREAEPSAPRVFFFTDGSEPIQC